MDDIPQVSQSENDFLTAPFTEKEIRDAIFDMPLLEYPPIAALNLELDMLYFVSVAM